MGMAASQARYLALTARKTNTEYEGQQINQARTALANQSANLFNRLLDLKVPDPPKTTDYTKIQYSYSDGDSDSVIESWQQLSNKDPQYNYVVNHYYYANLYTGSQKLLSDPQIHIGNVLKEIQYHDDTAQISYGHDRVTVKYKIIDEEKEVKYDKITKTQIQGDPSLKTAVTDFAKAKNMAMKDGLPVSDSIYGYKSGDTWHFYLANIKEQDYSRITQAMVDADTENTLKPYLRAQGYLDDTDHLTSDNVFGYQVPETNDWLFIEEDTSADILAKYEGESIDKKDYSMAIGPAYVGNSKLTELSELIVNDDIDMVAELRQTLKDCPDSSLNKYLSIDKDGNLVYAGSGIYTFDLQGKTYYTTETDLQNSAGHPYDPSKPIDLQEKLAYYNASYVKTKVSETNKALLETDEIGRFRSVKFDDDSVVYTLNTEEVTDEAAYQDAMNRYNYERARYEKTIADINAKTSIIQKEDRTLELRLKQLDTEQLALKTEMEAVKKVIKDNIDSTFKTFSD